MPAWAEGLVVTAGVDQDRRFLLERPAGVVVRGGDGSPAAYAGGREPCSDVVRELVETPLGAKVVVERPGEHEGVRDHGAALVISHEERWYVGRDVVEAAHLTAEVGAHDRLPNREDAPDVVGVPGVDVVAVKGPAEVGHVLQRHFGPSAGRIDALEPGA